MQIRKKKIIYFFSFIVILFISLDDQSYLEPQEPIAYSLTGTNRRFEEPIPIAYQLPPVVPNKFPLSKFLKLVNV